MPDCYFPPLTFQKHAHQDNRRLGTMWICVWMPRVPRWTGDPAHSVCLPLTHWLLWRLHQPPNNNNNNNDKNGPCRRDKAPPVAACCKCAPLSWVWFYNNLSAGPQASGPAGVWATLLLQFGWVELRITSKCAKKIFLLHKTNILSQIILFKKSLYSSQHNYNSISGTPCWNTERS